MRSSISALLIALGIIVIGIGLERPAAAWWYQQVPRVELAHAKSQISFPPGFVGRLRVPRLDASLYLVAAKTNRDLRRGPGYMPGFDRPGEENCIIAGHRDLHFRMLKDIKMGDQIEIDSPQGQFTYRVSSFEIVSPTDVDSLRARYPRQLTLITCYPFYYVGHAPKRFVVRAVLQ